MSDALRERIARVLADNVPHYVDCNRVTDAVLAELEQVGWLTRLDTLLFHEPDPEDGWGEVRPVYIMREDTAGGTP